MLEIGSNLMYLQKEYKVTHLVNERIIIEPTEIKDPIELQVNEKITIDGTFYKVIYINEGKKRITVIPLQ